MKTARLKKTMIRIQAALLCFLIILTFIPFQTVFATDDKDQTANDDIERTLAVTYKLKGGTEYLNLTAPYKINDITKVQTFHAECTFFINDIINSATGAVSRTVKKGDYYLIDLPQKLIVSNPATGNILGNGGRPIAVYSFVEESTSNWKIKIEFTDYVDDPNEYDIYGAMGFDFTVDVSSIGEGTSTTVYIPIDNENGINIDITNPVPPPTKPVSLTKTASSYNNVTRELVWNVKMMPDTGIFSGCTFTDTIDITHLELKSIKHGSLTLIQGTDYTYDPLTGKITYLITNGRDGASFQNIVITTAAKRSVYGSLSPTTISNTANLSGGVDYVDIDSNTSEYTITPNWFGKSGTVYQGNKIQWTLTANTTQQSMYNAVITDNLQADVKLDKSTVKLGSTAITVYDGSHTPANPSEVYGVYTENPDGTAVLKIYLPRNSINASTAKQVVTFVTDVTAPSTVQTDDRVYNNTAYLDANYITDGGGEGVLPTVNLSQVGVAVPYVSVVKSHATISADDKRDGTIRWTITAASNLTSYGKSTIVDTLPDDQEYIASEIYWGTTKIDETSTEPTVSISADGRKLTITFNNPNALTTQQTFSVKTRIKTDVYGQNVNRDFSNAVEGKIYSASGTVLDTATNTDKVKITNTVISKSSSSYTGNTTKQGENPRMQFSIVINSNLMPLSGVKITDDLSKIATEFKKSGESSFAAVSGVKWTYVPGTISITKSSGTTDSLDLAAIAAGATYASDIITVNFGPGALNDKYTITFIAELEVSQNDIFKTNGTIRCKGNIAGIEASGLKTGVISSPSTGNSSEIKNEVLGKTGVQNVAEQQAVFTININQHKVTLDSSKIVDNLPLGLTLDPTSIKLYTNVIGSDGNFITGSAVETQGTSVNFSYTYELSTDAGMAGRYVLTVQLPDNKTDYILRFATDIDKSLLGKQISNSAYYVGKAQAPESTNTSVMTFSATSGGGSTTKASVTVNKKSKDTGNALDGGVFGLYWLRGGDANDAVFVRSLTTTNGSVIFRGLTRGQKYVVKEISSPSGYLLDDPSPIDINVPSTGTADADPITFYDTPVKTGNWNPLAIKSLDGKSIIHTFNFELNDGVTALMSGVTQTALPNGNYTVGFTLNSGVNAAGLLNFTDDYKFNVSDPVGTEHTVAEKTLYMKEISSSLSGYGYDDTVRTLKIKVSNVKGTSALKVVITDGNGNVLSDNSGKFTPAGTPVFLNTYRADGSIQLSAKKTVENHSLAAGQFSFELYEGSALLETVSNTAGVLSGADNYTGNVIFSVIDYTQSDVGTKTYTIKEKNNALPGYTYDTAVYTVTVKIEDNDDGTLKSSVQSIEKTSGGSSVAAAEVSFVNVYTASDTDVNLTAAKTLSGRVIADNQFSFKLDRVSYAGDFISEVGVVKNAAENIALPKLTFTQSDIGRVYYYQITEVNSGNPGYTYDTRVYTVRIEISDNNDGTLKAEQTVTESNKPAAAILFKNTYKASGKTTITAQKTLTGKALPDSQFAFTLQQFDISTGAAIGSAQTVRNAADGKIVFPEINYTEADAGKDFYYKVTENNEGTGGYTYDTTEYTVRVSVTDNGDGTLNANQQITAPAAKTQITFANTYAAQDTFVEINAQKVLNGRTLEENQFTFVLNSITDTGIIISEVQRAKNAADGTINFDNIVYKQADMGKTYYYQITETQDGNAGYTYDASAYTVKVDITDNNDGTLTASKTIYKNSSSVAQAVFTNTYTTSDTTTTITAQKTLDGRVLEDGQFKYTLVLKGDGVNPDIPVGEAANNAAGEISFAPLTYKQADMGKTFVYYVKETNDNKPGYEYDNMVYTVQVQVTDNGDGTLTAQQQITFPAAAAKIEFKNKYVTTDTFTVMNAEKSLQGRVLEENQFTFVLNSVTDSGSIINEVQRVKNAADGTVNFDNIVYTQADMGKTYYYTISEANDSNPGYAYDSSVYNIKVDVTDNGDGTLTALKTITRGGQTTLSALFTNSYTTTNTSAQFAAEKVLDGRVLEDSQFKYTLTLKGEGANPDTLLEEVTNTAQGAVSFSPITYTQADMGKTFVYYVKETNENKPGYDYDNTVYTVEVQVKDNGDGTLTALQSITNPASASEMSFSNKYVTSNTLTSFTAQKILGGRALQDGQFTFVLKSVTDKGELISELQQIKNDADGMISFEDITYTQADMGKTYYYTVSETAEGNPGYAYDSTVYTVKVEVKDNGDGTLTAVKTITKEGQPALSMLFTNAYTTTNTTVKFAAQKFLTGRILAAGQFSYTLTLLGEGTQADKLIEKVTNTADGNINFTPITYTQADIGKTYIYSVKEVNGGKAGYEYDNTEYNIEVKVTDNGDGTISAKLSAVKTGDTNGMVPVKTLSFTNIYSAKGSVKFTAAKELKGLKLEDNMFKFILTDEQGNIIQTKYNSANGDIIFDEILFSQYQAGEHVYRIYEAAGNDAYYDYDASVYYVTVKITDNGDGTLNTAVSYQKDNGGNKSPVKNVSFVNVYNKPVNANSPKTGDSSELPLYLMLTLLSSVFIIVASRKKMR